MTFDRPWVLLMVWAPLAWAAWEWRDSARRGALILKACSILAILLALAEPRLTVYESKVALAILPDTSASISRQDLAEASRLVTAIDKEKRSNWTQVLPFARATRNPMPREHERQAWRLDYTPGPASHGTNLEAALREGLATLPAGLVPRVLLISDGNENLGSVTRAIWQARQLGVPIDTIPLSGRPRPSLLLDSVSLPAQVFTGEQFPIDVTLSSPKAARARLEITAEGRVLGASQVELSEGVNHFRAHATLSAVGAIAVAGVVSAPGLSEARFETALTLRRPKVLFVSQDPPAAEAHLLRTLTADQFEVQTAPGGVPENLEDYQLVIFNNWSMESIPLPRKTALEDFVKQGGGLLWIAGERNVYVEKKGEEDPLERTLPAKLAPPRTPEGTCVVLIIDKSSSMEGKKMELARTAAIGVVENLRPIDSVGVLIFDNSFQWAVPIRKAEDRMLIKRLISGITPDGGTQIAPALTEAYRRILPQRAVYKHIVLLTDGISEEGDSMALSRDALANHVTISTVGLGQDVNRAFLEKVATLAQGRAYFLSDPSGLQQILLRDVQEHTGSTAVEKNLHPLVMKQAEILEGVGMDQAPPLKGYIRFIPRPTADIILNADPKDPLLARWQYGLGRAAVFASDAKNRWAANWVNWPGFDRLWANVFRDLLPHAEASEATAEFDRASNELVVDYHLGRNVEEPAAIPDIYVFGPNGFRSPLKVSKMAAGHYRARVSIGENQGLFRVRPLAESRAFPEVGLYRQEDEMTEYGVNEQLLRQVAEATGGRFNPPVQRVFDSGGRTVPGTMALWPGLLAIAIALNLIELVLRKWKGLLESLRPAAQAFPRLLSS
ncbi:MAG TPA: VWA domain-containing protein [Bryobacteraceae bacterium]|nr:VWA domain-containing protein [Bryobacteraceae bacterium]